MIACSKDTPDSSAQTSSAVADAANVLDSRYSWARLAITLSIAIVGNAPMWMIIVIMPRVETEFAVDRAEVSLPIALSFLGFGVGNAQIGKIVGKIGIVIPLGCASLVAATGFVLASISNIFVLLCILQFVLGICAAATFAPLTVDISLWFARRRAVAICIAASGMYAAGVVWPIVLGGTVLDKHGWRIVYRMLAVVTLVNLPLALLLRRRVPAEAMKNQNLQAAQNASQARMSPRLLQWLLVIASVGCCLAMAMPQVHLTSMCKDAGFAEETGSRMLSLMLFGGVVSRIVSGFLGDRIGGVRTQLLGSFLQCLGLVLYLVYTLWLEGEGPLYAVSLGFGLSQGGIIPSYTVIIREYVPANEAASRAGFVTGMTVTAMALGSWMAGWIYTISGSYTAAFLNAIGWNIFHLLLMGGLWCRIGSGKPQQEVREVAADLVGNTQADSTDPNVSAQDDLSKTAPSVRNCV